MKKKIIYSLFKRFFDIVFSILLIIILGIPMIIISIVIKIDSKGPVLFKQKRIGKKQKKFTILKFRSMKINTDPNSPTHELENAETHITGFGKFIRKASLDELPQLFNILVGQMSFVGPRPALWNQYDLIFEREKYHANDVKPGLTGLAQISGRDELSIVDKAKLDGKYVEKQNLFFDMKIIFKTLFKVLKHDGVIEGSTGVLKNTEEKGENHENISR